MLYIIIITHVNINIKRVYVEPNNTFLKAELNDPCKEKSNGIELFKR